MVVERKITDLSLDDCERRKFDLNAENEVIVRTSAEGVFTPSGLTVSGLVTVLTIGSTAVKIPSTPLTGRNTISIHNKDTSLTLYIGFSSSVTADDSSTGGWEVPSGNYFNTDVTPDVEIWGVAASDITVKVLELA